MGLSIAHPTDDGEAFRVGSLSDAAGHDRQLSRRAPWNERLLRARAEAKLFARFLAIVSRSPSERRDKGRIGQASEGHSADGIAAPCNRLVGSHGGEASALFATAEACHRRKLRRLSNRRQLPRRYVFVSKGTPAHREKSDLFARYACMIQIGNGAGRLVKMTATNQEIDATPKARLLKGEHLVNHTGNFAGVLWRVNAHMDLLGGGAHESFKYSCAFERQTVRCECPRENSTERIEEVEHRRVFERFTTATRDGPDAVRREIHAERTQLICGPNICIC